MPKINNLIFLFFSLSLALVSCHSIYPLGQGSDSQRIYTKTEVLPFEVQMAEISPYKSSEIRLKPDKFILKYSRIAEVSAPISEGKASWYGPNFHGRLTASGEQFDMHKRTAAHPSLPFGTLVWVENKQNGSGVLVRINDRGPYADDRVIDLSKSAAQELRILGHGVTHVQLFVVKKRAEFPNTERDNPSLYTIQLGIFKKGDKAFEYAKRIEGSRVEVFNEHNQKYFGVFFGWYLDREIALSKKEELAQQKFVGHVRKMETG